MGTAAETQRVPNNLDVQGDLTVRGTKPAYARSELTQDDFAIYPLEKRLWSIWDAIQTGLTTAASDDLGLTAGAFATGCSYITGGDCKTISATRRARIEFTLPPEYVAGQTVQIRAAAGMLTTVADGSCTVDFEAYISNRDTLKTGSDLVTTAAQSINSLTFAEKVFDLTGTNLSPGTVLDVRMTITAVDTATVGAVTPAVAHTEIRADVKG